MKVAHEQRQCLGGYVVWEHAEVSRPALNTKQDGQGPIGPTFLPVLITPRVHKGTRELLKWWTSKWILTCKSFLDSLKPVSFSLCSLGFRMQQPYSSQGFPRVQGEVAPLTPPTSSWRHWQLWNTPEYWLLKVSGFYSWSEARAAIFFFLSGPLHRVQWSLCCLIPVKGEKEWNSAELLSQVERGLCCSSYCFGLFFSW